MCIPQAPSSLRCQGLDILGREPLLAVCTRTGCGGSGMEVCSEAMLPKVLAMDSHQGVKELHDLAAWHTILQELQDHLPAL